MSAVTSFLGISVLDPILNASDYLARVFPNKGAVELEMLLDRKSDPGLGRKRSIVMTQNDPKTPRADREAFQVASGDTMKAIVYTQY